MFFSLSSSLFSSSNDHFASLLQCLHLIPHCIYSNRFSTLNFKLSARIFFSSLFCPLRTFEMFFFLYLCCRHEVLVSLIVYNIIVLSSVFFWRKAQSFRIYSSTLSFIVVIIVGLEPNQWNYLLYLRLFNSVLVVKRVNEKETEKNRLFINKSNYVLDESLSLSISCTVLP